MTPTRFSSAFLEVGNIFWEIWVANVQLTSSPFHGRLVELKLPSSVRSKVISRGNTEGPTFGPLEGHEIDVK